MRLPAAAPLFFFVFAPSALLYTGPALGAAPTAAQALSLAPTQPGVEYDKPNAAEARGCRVDQSGDKTAWIVKNTSGQTLRRFADTNRDNVVDVWSYYRDGMEVYRDLDTDFDSKADECRWFNSAGSRWGVDRDQDGDIDAWKAISPHEVGEAVVAAVQAKDEAAFAALLLSPAELKRLGAGGGLTSRLTRSIAAAPGAFRKLVGGGQALSPGGRFADFGAARPSLLPAGVDGATKDVLVYQNVSALVGDGAGDGAEQVQIGLLVKTGDAWRVVDAPQVGDEAVTVAATLASATPAGDAPSEAVQELMSELERLDQQPTGKTPSDRLATFKQRSKLLQRLAAATPKGELRDQWFNQLADMFSAAVIDGEVKDASGLLERLEAQATKAGAGVDARAHMRFQRIYTDWVTKGQDPKADYARLQEDWRKSLRAFAKAFPGSPDTAEALLQLGMVDDLAGRDEEAAEWYTRLARDFDGSPRAAKAAGALRRLGSPGKAIALRGAGLGGGELDLARYRGKVVAVQYWATWCEPCKEDMKTLRELVAKYGAKGFAVLGVNLDAQQEDARRFVAQARTPWKHLYEPGGLEGRLANEMGVINLPLMLLVDKSGKVVSRNIRADEIEAELRKTLR